MQEVFNQLLEYSLLFRLLLAIMCGFVLGYERERHGRSAGLRTNILVCLGSCLMMIVSEYFFRKYGNISSNTAVRLDPARVAAQIIAGIGFIGAGVIIKDKGGIRGLTTAATLWLVAGIGMAAGAGLIVMSITGTGMALIVLTVLKTYEKEIPRDNYKVIHTICDEADNNALEMITNYINSQNMKITNINYDYDTLNARITYVITVIIKQNESIVIVTKELSKYPFVKQIKLEAI